MSDLWRLGLLDGTGREACDAAVHEKAYSTMIGSTPVIQAAMSDPQ